MGPEADCKLKPPSKTKISNMWAGANVDKAVRPHGELLLLIEQQKHEIQRQQRKLDRKRQRPSHSQKGGHAFATKMQSNVGVTRRTPKKLPKVSSGDSSHGRPLYNGLWNAFEQWEAAGQACHARPS